MSTPTRMSAADYQRQFGRASDAVAKAGKESVLRPQIRIPKGHAPNKTEESWMNRLARTHCGHAGFTVLYEPFTLRLPSGTRYTPDVVTVQGFPRKELFEIAPMALGCILCIYEVKGNHIHNSASIRAFKEAKASFPFWHFVFAQKRGTEWTETA